MTDAVLEVQRLYPQIFVACHTRHVRAASTRWKISSQDASILVHLDRREGLSPRALARHLGVAASTLSAAVSRLARLGYLTNDAVASDRRQRTLRLTARGASAIASTSVLDAARTRAMLSQLGAADLKAALHGLSLLAAAARKLPAKSEAS